MISRAVEKTFRRQPSDFIIKLAIGRKHIKQKSELLRESGRLAEAKELFESLPGGSARPFSKRT